MPEVEDIPFPELPPFHKRLYDTFLAFGIGKGVTLDEIRTAMGYELHEQPQMRKRISELRQYQFDVGRVGQRGRVHLYALNSPNPTGIKRGTRSISQKLRAQVLNMAAGRCQMCGSTVAKDGVKLVIDHKIPLEWGGTDELSNLWGICEDCNGGKRDFFQSFDADLMRKCMSHPEEPRRIGELLKAFDGEAPPRYLLSVVAGGAEWTKRLRQLRLIGWEIEKTWSKEEGNWTYKLVNAKPWPGNLWKAIKDAEDAGK